MIGLFDTEVIRHAVPWRGLDDVDFATLEWVARFDTRRLLAPLGHLAPAEYEAQCQEAPTTPAVVGALGQTRPRGTPGRFTVARPAGS